MQTSLLGRKVKGYCDGIIGTIVGIYIDRGVMKLIVENPDSRLIIHDAENTALVPL